MEDHKAELGADGKPKTDSHGRLIPTAELTNVFVQEKQPGWGAEYGPEKRNGEWEYGWFLADGSVKPDAKFDRCFECHLKVAGDDYNYTLAAFLRDIKK